MNKKLIALLIVCFATVLTACKKTQDLVPIENALNLFVADLQNDPPTEANLSERVRIYITAQPTNFFGSTVALLNSAGKVVSSPYHYRKNGSIVYKNIVTPGYDIDNQAWLRNPIDQKKSIWTDPFFDAGGGDIWMRTYSVPVIVNGRIIAVATTDMQVAKP